jgi:hypothetical protein
MIGAELQIDQLFAPIARAEFVPEKFSERQGSGA